MTIRITLNGIALFVFLVSAGAAVNIAVALACAAYVNVPITDIEDNIAEAGCVWMHSPFRTIAKGHFTTIGASCAVSGREATFIHFSFRLPMQTKRNDFMYGRVVSGWPMRSMQGEVWQSCSLGAVVKGQRQYVGALQGWRQPEDWFACFWPSANLLPLSPRLSAFAINTLFYAAICWALFCGPFVIRKWRRRRKGLCPACAYPVGRGNSDVCTECGHSVPEGNRR